ncbi:MAG: hypothetical protein JSR54_06735 [Proteobacteria bacterium]|nr:hypothetical protein [Pseudomonadota bacterium]
MRRSNGWSAAILGLALAGCHHGSSPPPQRYALGGSISGLTVAGLTLTNGADSLSPAAGATTFTFATRLASGTAYNVQIGATPAGLACTVANGQGTMPAADVTNVTVTCTPRSYTLGGTITGLAAGGLVLANGTDTVAPPAQATQFSFTQPVAFGATYSVTVQNQPAAGTCSVSGGSGTMPAAAVQSVSVTCTAPPSESLLHSFAGGTSDGAQPTGGLVLATDGQLYGMTYASGSGQAGVFYSLTTAGTYTLLHAFTATATDTGGPLGALIQGSDGNFYGTGQYGGSHLSGAVVQVTPAGAVTLLHSFAGGSADGSDPQGGVVRASDGTLYGTTYTGGGNNLGTVWKLATDGTLTLLHAFAGAGSSDGAYPRAGLMLASDGNLYGTTSGGGAHNAGTVFSVTPAGSYAVVYSFSGGAGDGGDPRGELVEGADGALYGLSYDGGAANLGTLYRLTKAGSESVLYAFTGTGDGAYPYGALLLGADGNFYGLTFGDGTSQLGSLFRATPVGAVTPLHAFAGGAGDGADPIGRLVQGSDGTLYGVTYNGGAANLGTVFKLTAP